MKLSVYGIGSSDCRPGLPVHFRSAPVSSKNVKNFDTADFSSRQSRRKDFAHELARQAAMEVLAYDGSAGSVPNLRVEELARQVADGSYQPDPFKIAGKLLGIP